MVTEPPWTERDIRMSDIMEHRASTPFGFKLAKTKLVQTKRIEPKQACARSTLSSGFG